jgi:transposase
MYEAGFRGFELHDELVADGWECVVTPPHTVTEEKVQRKKNDRTDCRRLAKNLENGDYRKCFVPDKELREDRQISRTYGQVQADIKRVRNRIRRMLEFHGLDNGLPAGRWSGAAYTRLRQHLAEIEMSDSLRLSFETMLKELEYLRQLKKGLLLQLRRLARSDRYKRSVELLKSAPGIGMLTAIRLTLE